MTDEERHDPAYAERLAHLAGERPDPMKHFSTRRG